jgi:hypothetical protein
LGVNARELAGLQIMASFVLGEAVPITMLGHNSASNDPRHRALPDLGMFSALAVSVWLPGVGKGARSFTATALGATRDL